MKPLDYVVHRDVRRGTRKYLGPLRSDGLKDKFNYCSGLTRAWRSMNHANISCHEALSDGFFLCSIQPLVIHLQTVDIEFIGHVHLLGRNFLEKDIN